MYLSLIRLKDFVFEADCPDSRDFLLDAIVGNFTPTGTDATHVNDGLDKSGV